MRPVDFRASTALPPQPYVQEWRRSCPDFLVFHPAPDGKPRWNDDDFFVLNEHFIVAQLGPGRLLATWTAHGPSLRFRRVAVARSNDGGETWTAPDVVAGGPEASAAWSVPVVGPGGRIYLVYSDYGGDRQLHGGACRMAWRVSNDGGKHWSKPALRELRPAGVDAPAGTASFLFWRQCETDAKGRPLLAFTRIGRSADLAGRAPKRKWCQSECLRVENLDMSPDPSDLEFYYLPADARDALLVAQPEEAHISWANEPSFVPLPDGRIFVAMRTRQGRLYWSVNDESGSFCEPTVMRYHDDGDEILQPGSPAPLYRLDEGRFLLVFNNNDGTAFGATETHDPANRRPCYLSAGSFDPTQRQPLRFEDPFLFVDNDGIPVDLVGNEPRYEAAAYGSLTGQEGDYVLWYPDRKHFLVGKKIPRCLIAQKP